MMRGMEVPEDPMTERVTRALSWKAGGQVLAQISSMVVLVVLAHELTPADYGLAGMVLVFSTLVYIFADLALGSALIQREAPDQTDRSTVFWVSAASGTVCTLLVIGLAGPIAGFFHEPSIVPLLRSFSVTFLLTSLGTVPYALLARKLDFRALELRSIAASLTGAAIAIALAFSGAGAWAIIAQQITVALVGTALMWMLAAWRPSLRISRSAVREMGGFGANVFGTRLLFYVERNIDNVLVGRVLGPAALGVYALSYNLMLIPLERIGGPMAEVLFPAFSRMNQDLARLSSAWLRAVRMLAAVVVPMMLLLMVLAPDIVHVVLGSQWGAAVPVVTILAWVGLHQSLQRFNSSVLQAADRTGPLLRFSIVSACVNISAFAVGLIWGVTGVAAAYAISSTLVAPLYLRLTARAVDLPMRAFFANLRGVVSAAVPTAAAAGLLRWWMTGWIDTPVIRLLIILPLAGVLYIALARITDRGLVADVEEVVPERIKQRLRRLLPGWFTRRYGVGTP